MTKPTEIVPGSGVEGVPMVLDPALLASIERKKL